MNNEHVSFMLRVLSDESKHFLSLTVSVTLGSTSDAVGRARPWYLSQFIWFHRHLCHICSELGTGPGAAVTKMREAQPYLHEIHTVVGD